MERPWQSREGSMAEEFSDPVTAEEKALGFPSSFYGFLPANYSEDLENWKRKLGTGIWNMESLGGVVYVSLSPLMVAYGG